MTAPLHSGIIRSISDDHIQVSILQDTSCTSCRARHLCTPSQGKVRTIDVYHPHAHLYKEGDEVHVFGSTSHQTSAVLIAFGIPLLLTIVWVILSAGVFHLSDVQTLLLLPIPLGIYIMVLCHRRQQIDRTFTFTIEKKTH